MATLSRPSSEAVAAAVQPDHAPAWTMEITLLAPGLYGASVAEFANIAEFKDCVAEGPTRQAALKALETVLQRRLQLARERGETIPLLEDEEQSRLSIRIPRSVRRRLARLAEVEGVSLNALISSVLSEHVGKGRDLLPGDFPRAELELRQLIPQLRDWDSEQAAGAVKAAEDLIRSVEDRRGTNLGLALRALVADRKFAVEGQHEASRHLGKSARVALDAGHDNLAEAFWQASLHLETDNPISNGAYGQFLFNRGLFNRDDYKKAIPCLKKTLSNSSLPWSPVQLALCELHIAPDPESRQAAAANVLDMLKASAVDKQALAHRQSWLRYARMLHQADVLTDDEIDRLVESAREQARWKPPIELSEVLNGGKR